MSLKGRYYQGFLIAMPQPSMGNTVINETVFSASIENLYEILQDEITKTEALRKSFDAQVERFLANNPFNFAEKDHDAYLEKFCRELKNVRMVFICDRRGNQLTSNIFLKTGDGADNSGRLEKFKNRNWVWRGYFYEALKSATLGQKSCMSSAYRDFSTKENVRTYSYAISDDIFLFVDIA